MPDPVQNQNNSDQLSPEDSAALVHAQQQLYAAGDPRASKLYNYIVQAGYATKGDNGELHPQGETKSFYDKYLKGTLSGNAGWQQAIDKAATPPEIHSAGDIANALGAGTTQMFGSPVAHPLRTLGAMGKMAAAGLGDTQAQHDVAESMVRPFVENPSGSAVAAVPQAAMALLGGGEAKPAVNAIERSGGEGGLVGTVSDAAQANRPRLFPEGPPESIMTKAVRPGKNNAGWTADAPIAIQQMKSVEQQMGKPIASIDDAIDASVLAKKNIWQQVQARLGPAAKLGGTIDGNVIADAMVKSIDRRTALQNPGLLDQIKQVADTYRRQMPVSEAEEFLQSNNQELIGYYGKNKVSRAQAAADPTVAYKLAEGDALRDALYSKLDELTGPGVAQLKKAYGALSNMQKELVGRKIVYERQAPANLPTQLSYGPAVGKIVTGNVIGGLKDIAVQRYFNELNDTNAQIGRAFQKAQPAAPFPAPSIRMPQTVRLLPAQAGGKIPQLAPDPGMTPGENISALMYLLRQKGQPLLPAKTVPIQLPPQF